jgi:hypothetical protein
VKSKTLNIQFPPPLISHHLQIISQLQHQHQDDLEDDPDYIDVEEEEWGEEDLVNVKTL